MMYLIKCNNNPKQHWVRWILLNDLFLNQSILVIFSIYLYVIFKKTDRKTQQSQITLWVGKEKYSQDIRYGHKKEWEIHFKCEVWEAQLGLGTSGWCFILKASLPSLDRPSTLLMYRNAYNTLLDKPKQCLSLLICLPSGASILIVPLLGKGERKEWRKLWE